MKITNGALATLLTDLLTNPNSGEVDTMERFEQFMTDLTQVVCNHCGGEIMTETSYAGMTNDSEFGTAYLVEVEANASSPANGGVWGQQPVSNDTIAVPRDVLSMLIDIGNTHVEDINSGLEDGTYTADENPNIGRKNAAVEAAEALYRKATTGGNTPHDEAPLILVGETSSKPGLSAQECANMLGTHERKMRFKVTIDAVTGNDEDAPVHLGAVTVTITGHENLDAAKIAAELEAMDELWDNRLDGTCHPKVFITQVPSYLIAENWDHIFEGIGNRNVRFCYDYLTERLEHLQVSHSVKGWQPATEDQRRDVEDSLKNANTDALNNPKEWGCETSDNVPAWC